MSTDAEPGEIPLEFVRMAESRSDKQLAALYGWSRTKVRYWRRRLKVTGQRLDRKRKFTPQVRDFICRNWWQWGPTELAEKLTENDEFPGEYSRSGVSGIARELGLPLKREPSKRQVLAALPQVRWRCDHGVLHEGGYPHCPCR